MKFATLTLRLTFTKIPESDDRIFRDNLVIADMETNVQELFNIVESKLKFLELDSHTYTVLFQTATGEKTVVDDAFFLILVEDLISSHSAALDKEDGEDTEVHIKIPVSFDIEIGKALPTQYVPQKQQALTRDALAAVATKDGAELKIQNITAVPLFANFSIEACVVSIRHKKAPICELELCDRENWNTKITAVSFDSDITSDISRTIAGNGTFVVKIFRPTVVPKTDRDKQFQSNSHAFTLRLTKTTLIKVICILPAPIRAAPCSIVDKPHNVPTGIAYFGKPQMQEQVASNSSSSGSATHVSATSSSSTSLNSHHQQTDNFALRKTIFRFPSTTPIIPTLPPPAVSGASSRDFITDRHREKLEDRRERMLACGMVSSKCILCDLDTTDDACLREAHELLRRSSRNRGTFLPSLQQLQQELADRREAYKNNHAATSRHYCKARIMNMFDNSLHLVHPRCAHLCRTYQSGSELEDVVLTKRMACCELCRQAGAVVSCYHPDCNESYHVICAVFSCGYVNFGKRDPVLPCAACPRHTEVLIDPKRGIKRLREREESDVVFDSGDVEGMLRDPDDASDHIDA